MYGMILMAAMATGAEAPDFRCHGRNNTAGCHGGCYGTCYGSCIGAYYGTYYGSCFGCYGSGYGCCGVSSLGCHGGYGLVGYATYGCHGCYGCYGCYGCTGYAPGYTPSLIVPGAPTMPPAGGDVLPAPKPSGSSEANVVPRAKLVVELPADANLYIDDQLMKTTSERRTFNTPVLDKGQTYYYELKAEVMRDGKAVTQTRRVTLRAGDLVEARRNSRSR